MNKYKVILLALFISLFFMGSVSAIDIENMDNNQTISTDFHGNIDSNHNSTVLKQTDFEEDIGESEEIVVNDWDELQYYCSLNDNQVLKLKENTNYYPNNPDDSNYQIVVNNNVKIIGSEGAYFGDSSNNPRNITYTAIKVNDNTGIGITLQNVHFKWISTYYQPDGVFLQMAGNADNAIENCYFNEISTNLGHSSIIHIKSGHVSLTNCTFINCTTDFGCLSVYNPNDDPTGTCTGASMEVSDSYFEGNYARTEPGCINNCGVLVVNNSTFYKNSAFWWAGAIHTHGGANTTIYDSNFYDNVAGWNGGALYTYSYLQIYRSNFIGNNCTTNNGGGAIGACKYLHAPYIHIEDSLFKDNENLCWSLSEQSTTGTGRGGAISLMDEGGLEVYNSIFIKNSASIGTAICAISGGLSYGSPDVRIVGNQFINHTRMGDVLDIRLATGSVAEIRDNYFSNNSIVFSKLKLAADNPTSTGEVTFHIDAALKNPNSYDSDILDKSEYDVYVNGVYETTVSSRDFTLDLGKGNTAYIYVVPSISNSKSNNVFAGIEKTFIFVSQNSGNDANNGSTRGSAVKTLARAIELANVTENIVIMDGTFGETDLTINYNLTILAENNAAITVTGNAFKITNGDVKFQNLTFRNSKYGSSTKNRLISQENNGFLIFEGCSFEGNEYKMHIESSGNVEGENLYFTNNKDGSLFRCNSISLKSSVFFKNTATYSLYPSLIMYNTQTSKLELENLTFTGNTVYQGCIDTKKGSGTIYDCTFIGNSVSSSGKSSAVFIEDGSSLLIQSSKFINNTDKGKYSSVIYLSSGSLLIRDSILINNRYENDNNAIISGGDTYLKRLVAENNWWGNTPDNLDKPALKVFPPSNNLPNGWDPAQYWLVLNATSISNKIELNKMVPVQFSFTQINNEGNITAYDGYSLPDFDLYLSAVNGTCSDSKITVKNGMATTYFALNQKSTASLTGTFNGITATINFEFIKSIPEFTIETNDIYVGDNADVTVYFQSGVEGEVILKIGNMTKYGTISNSKATFIIPNLPAGNHTVEVNYTGNDKYDETIKNTTLAVNKHDSITQLSVGAIELDKDVVLTISLSDGATGIVDVYVNGIKETIDVGQTFTIKNIARGDYIVKAVYEGDGYYLASEDEFIFEVGKLIPTLSVNVSDIIYGNDVIVKIALEDDAGGTVSVTVDGKTVTKEVINGKTSINIEKVDAGKNKIVNIFYSGDNNYKNASINKTFNINKENLDFNISSINVKLGMEAIVEIRLPTRVGGQMSINGIKSEVKDVPASGVITLRYSDLSIGTYTISAEYNGNNYNTISKSTTFIVSDWDSPQWANDGGNIRHTGKSPYGSDANGEVKWTGQADEITGNLAIDSQGNIYITTRNGIYSFNPDGDLRWTFLSTSAGTSFSGISIGRDVIISPKLDDTLYFINQSTGERYGHANLYQGSSLFSPVVDANGNVYISGQGGSGNNPNLIIIPYNLWENGGNPTVISLGSSPSAAPTIIADDLVCVPCENGLKIVNVSSKQVISSISGTIKGMAIVGDGDIIYSFKDDSIIALNYLGQEIWTQKVTGGVGDRLFLDSEQALYAVNAKGELYKYDLIDGSESKFTDLNVTSGILIGNDNNIYFAADEVFYALDYEANILWKSNLEDKIIGTPIMDENGAIYVNSLNKVYALQKFNLKDVNLAISTQTITVGCDEIITITLNENATGWISINLNGNISSEEIAGGKIVKNVSNLATGNYTVTVNYSGDLRYAQSTKSSDFSVLKINPDFIVDVKNIRYGEDAVFNVILPNNATGTVTVNVNNKNKSCEVAGGKALITISGLIKGDYEYSVIYSGDDLYNSSIKSGIISVEKIEFTFNVKEIGTVNVGDSVEFIISDLPQYSSGKISVEVGGLSNFTTSNNGQAIVILNGLKSNNYTAIIKYYDDDFYMANPKSISFNVIKRDISFEVNVNDINVGENVTFRISGLPNDAVGNIQVSIDDISQSNFPTNGETIIDVEGLSFGRKQAIITFVGDDKYNSKSIMRQFNVNKIDPSFSVDNVVNTFVSQKVEFRAYLDLDAYGNISVIDENGNVIGESEFRNGQANLVVNGFAYGNKTVIIKYSGNYKYLSKNITKTFFVDKIRTNLIVNAPSRIEQGTDIIFDVSLPSDATGKVIVTVDTISKVFDAKSSLNIPVSNLEEGSKTAYISYSGDSKYHSVVITKDFVVDRQLIVRTLPNINVTVEDCNVGSPARFMINLNGDALGSVEVNVEGIYNSSEVINGQAIVLINDLKSGVKNARIAYSGDEKYNDTVVLKQFSVNKIVPTVNVGCNNISVDDFAEFDIALNPDATGMVVVRIGSKTNSSILTEGMAKIIITGLSSGIKTATIDYLGDDKYLPRNVSYDVSVNKLNAPIIVIGEDVDFNSIANINVNLPEGAHGSVKLILGDEIYNRTVVISNVTFSISNLNVGNYIAKIIYSGDDNYIENSTDYTFKVNKIKPAINLVVSQNINYAENANMSITISNAKGNISVLLDGKEIYHDLINENIIIPLNNLDVGSHLIDVTYLGDNNYFANSINKTVTVKKNIPEEDREVLIDVVEGTTFLKFSIKLPNNATGLFTVYVDGKAYTKELDKGQATIDVENLNAGNHVISTSYTGDGFYEGFSSKASAVNIPKVSIPNGENVFVMDSSKGIDSPIFSINLPSDATGDLIVTVDGKYTYIKTLSNGMASVAVDKLGFGSHNIQLVYLGDVKYSSISKNVVVDVKNPVVPIVPIVKLNVKLTAKKKTFKAKTKIKKYTVTLKAGSSAVKNVRLTLKIKGKTFTAKTNAKGKATFKIKKLTKKGKFTAVVKFKGDNNYNPVTKKVRLTIK